MAWKNREIPLQNWENIECLIDRNKKSLCKRRWEFLTLVFFYSLGVVYTYIIYRCYTTCTHDVQQWFKYKTDRLKNIESSR